VNELRLPISQMLDHTLEFGVIEHGNHHSATPAPQLLHRVIGRLTERA
jgi:hypothetical protein